MRALPAQGASTHVPLAILWGPSIPLLPLPAGPRGQCGIAGEVATPDAYKPGTALVRKGGGFVFRRQLEQLGFTCRSQIVR